MNGMNEKNNRNENNCHVFRFENETGEGTITAYDIFPGVIVAYNDFHMNYYDSATLHLYRIRMFFVSIIAERGGWNIRPEKMHFRMWKLEI